MPLVVVALLSVEMAAYFYAAAMVAGLLTMLPSALTTVLYRLVAADPGSLARRFRFTLALALLAGGLIYTAMAVAARPLLSPLGPSYVEYTEWPLRLLCLNIFPVIIREHYATLNRLHGRPEAALGLILAGTVLAVGGGAIGAITGGLTGLCVGVVIGMGLETSAMLPAVLRAVWPAPATTAAPPRAEARPSTLVGTPEPAPGRPARPH
jgi:hypothetical protein